MIWNDDKNPELDDELRAKLDLLREVPPRHPEAEARALARFMTELEALEHASAPAPSTTPARRFIRIPPLKEKLAMFNLSRNPLTTIGVAALLILVFLFGGATLTAQAARSALPGDALYSLKTGLEQARLSTTSDLTAQADLYLAFAQTRLDEINALASAGRYDDIPALAEQFRQYIERALEASRSLAETDPARAAELSSRINSTLTSLLGQLSALMASMPETVRNSVQQTVNFSQDRLPSSSNANENGAVENVNESLENANGDDNVNDDNANNANANNANANEACGDDDGDGSPDCDENSNGNMNGDDNGNGNDNGNENGNDNGDDNGNHNGDDDNGGNNNGNDNRGNDNDDRGGNDNGGKGGDDGGNDNGDDD